MKRTLTSSLAIAIALTPALHGFAQAHEGRMITDAMTGKAIGLTVGWHVEPALEDGYNAVDVILKQVDVAACNGKDVSVPIDTAASAGDTVDLNVDVIYLRQSVRPGGSASSAKNDPPQGVISGLTITRTSPLKELFGAPGTYNSWFRPTHPGSGDAGAGAYGFRVYGTVKATAKTVACEKDNYSLAARQFTLDTWFVCGAVGSMSLGKSFSCVTTIQPFPGKAEDGYKPSVVYHR